MGLEGLSLLFRVSPAFSFTTYFFSPDRQGITHGLLNPTGLYHQVLTRVDELKSSRARVDLQNFDAQQPLRIYSTKAMVHQHQLSTASVKR